MPSTRKQKAEEKRSRQSDVISDLENMDIMLRFYSKNDLHCQSEEKETEGDLESNRLQSANPTICDFRSLVNTNSRKNIEIFIETAKMIYNEITTEVTRKLGGLRRDLNTQILDDVSSANAEKLLPSIQNVLGVLYRRLYRSPEDHSSHLDHRSRGPDGSPRDYFSHMDHRTRGLNDGPRDRSGQMGLEPRGLTGALEITMAKWTTGPVDKTRILEVNLVKCPGLGC